MITFLGLNNGLHGTIAFVNRATRLYNAILLDPTATEFAADTVLLAVIASKIGTLAPKPDISGDERRRKRGIAEGLNEGAYAL